MNRVRKKSEERIYIMLHIPFFVICKIGISKNTKRRAKDVSDSIVGFALPICAVKSKYAFQIEQWMHEQLKVLNVKFHGSGKTEWFWLPALLLALPTLFFVWASEWILYLIAALVLLKITNCI